MVKLFIQDEKPSAREYILALNLSDEARLLVGMLESHAGIIMKVL